MQDDTLTPDDRDFVTALASGLEVIQPSTTKPRA